MSFTEILDARTSWVFFPNLPPPGRSTLQKYISLIEYLKQYLMEYPTEYQQNAS